MAVISRATGTLSIDVTTAHALLSQDGNLIAGEALGVGDACYIKGSDGKVYAAISTVWMVTGSGGQVAFDGICLTNVSSGDPVTLAGAGAVIGSYSAGKTPQTALYVHSVKGELADAQAAAATTDKPVAKFISATDIKVLR
jgi:hypothetical protein